MRNPRLTSQRMLALILALALIFGGTVSTQAHDLRAPNSSVASSIPFVPPAQPAPTETPCFGPGGSATCTPTAASPTATSCISSTGATCTPTTIATSIPTRTPTRTPVSSTPTATPTDFPIGNPTATPTDFPIGNPTATPTRTNTPLPIGFPTSTPTPVNCVPGGTIPPTRDLDGDALPDIWEINGHNGVNLPAMGASPCHKDLFVEVDYFVDVDYMVANDHSHKPKAEALAALMIAFNNAPLTNLDGQTGIRLHIDAGPNTFMNAGPGVKWGSLSGSTSIVETNKLLIWSGFDAYANTFFTSARRDVFYYTIFAHQLKTSTQGLGNTSGYSRGLAASNFVVSLGGWTDNVGTVPEQAGTFMHEFGHALGLGHGGADGFNYKPNYFSVMNYMFQKGVLTNKPSGTSWLDYSRFNNIPGLNETGGLIEPVGINGGAAINGYSTRRKLGPNGPGMIVANANGPIDWNLDGTISPAPLNFAVDINADLLANFLTSQNDWVNLTFGGGSIGNGTLLEGRDHAAPNHADHEHPAMEEHSDITFEEAESYPDAYRVTLTGGNDLTVQPGGSYTTSLVITNRGEQPDRYDLIASSDLPWADLRQVPNQLDLAAGSSITFTIPINVPTVVTPGQTVNLTFNVSNEDVEGHQETTDSREVRVVVAGGPSLCTVRYSDVLTSNIFYNDILFLGCRSVISGLPNGDGTFRFEPNRNTTRGQFAKIATLGFALPDYSSQTDLFRDVNRANIFYNYIQAAGHAGVINGLSPQQCVALGLQSPCFGPNLNISRVQVVVIVRRALDSALTTPTTPTFADLPANAFGYAEVETLVARSIVNGALCSSGSGQCFRPNDNIRRGELSKVVRRAIESLP